MRPVVLLPVSISIFVAIFWWPASKSENPPSAIDTKSCIGCQSRIMVRFALKQDDATPLGSLGCLQSTNEVFFQKSYFGNVELTFNIPRAGRYNVALKGRPGAYAFGTVDGYEGPHIGECARLDTNLTLRAIRINKPGNTDSFYICQNSVAASPAASPFGFVPNCIEYGVTGWRTKESTHEFNFTKGNNSLWLRNRELCTLGSHLTITSAG